MYTNYCDQKDSWIFLKNVNSLFILPHQFYSLQSNPRPIQRTFANAFSSTRNSRNRLFPPQPLRSSSLRFLPPQSSQNDVQVRVFWIAKSHMETNQANIVIAKRYESSLDKNGMVHYRDLGNNRDLTRFRHKTLFKMF